MQDSHDDLVRGFVEAGRRGDVVALCGVLDAEVTAVCDSGGWLPAGLGVVRGAMDVARFVAALLCESGSGLGWGSGSGSGSDGAELSVEAVNGRAGVAVRRAGRAVAVVAIDGGGSGITALWIVLNPDKLRGWHRAGVLHPD